jgi:hypothetical protein
MTTGRLKKIVEILTNPASLPVTLLIAVSDVLDAEWLTWDPETITMEIEDTLHTEIEPHNFNKLMAAVAIVGSDEFYSDLPSFIDLCNALYNGTFNPGQFDPADPLEIACGITDAMLLWPPDNMQENPFSDDIVKYCAATIKDEGIMTPPDILQQFMVGDDAWNQIQADFSDDPMMFDSIYKMEQDKTNEINALVRARLHAMLQQMDALELEHGDAKGAVVRMLKALDKQKTKSEETHPLLES